MLVLRAPTEVFAEELPSTVTQEQRKPRKKLTFVPPPKQRNMKGQTSSASQTQDVKAFCIRTGSAERNRLWELWESLLWIRGAVVLQV